MAEQQFPAKGTRLTLLRYFSVEGEDVCILRRYKHHPQYFIEQFKLREAGKPYDEGAWEYDDIEIAHHDCEIEIIDDHAQFIESDDGRIRLDYDMENIRKQIAKVKEQRSGNQNTTE